MFCSFQVSNFRCFSALSLSDLDRVNLITGSNDVGKTALLEALFLHVGGHNPELSLRLNVFRGFEPILPDPDDTWGWLFRGRQSLGKAIELTSIDDADRKRVLRVTLRVPEKMVFPASAEQPPPGKKAPGLPTTAIGQRELYLEMSGHNGNMLSSSAVFADGRVELRLAPTQPFPTGFFLSTRSRTSQEEATRFSKLQETGLDEQVVNALRILEPRLRRLVIHTAENVITIRGDIGLDRLVPLGFMGEGVTRLLSMVQAVLSCEDGIVLIDEIENGLHYSVMPQVWEALGEAARSRNVQLFATTHSRECILAAHQAFSSQLSYDLRVHRLEASNGDVRVITYDKETLATSQELNLEIR